MIRPMTIEDRQAVAGVWHDSWHDSHAVLLPDWVAACRTPYTFEARLRAMPGRCFVADDNGAIAGFGVAAGIEVYQLFMAPRARGTGLASLLLARLEAALWYDGVFHAIVECAEGNVRARAFYSKHGWEIDGIMARPIWMPEGQSFLHPTCRLFKYLSRPA